MKFQLMLLPLLAHLVVTQAWTQQRDPDPQEGSLSVSTCLQQQEPTSPPQQGAAQSLKEKSTSLEIPVNPSEEYVLGPGDIIEISVIGIPGLEHQELTLDGQCRISLPYINQIRLNGMTAHDAETKIAALYEVSLLQDPQVSVKVKEHKSQYCYVFGAVRNPGKYQLAQQTFLLDALTLAGGLTDKADVRLRIRHGYATDSTPQANDSSVPTESQEINLTELFDNGDPRRNIAIHSGDVITVPERREGLYFVMGDIQKPGAFTLPNHEKVTLSRALANAGGPLKTAAAGKTMIIRPKPGSELPTQIRVDATAVLKGKIQDVELQDNDIVLVPGSATKTVGKNFFAGLNSLLTSLLILGVR